MNHNEDRHRSIAQVITNAMPSSDRLRARFGQRLRRQWISQLRPQRSDILRSVVPGLLVIGVVVAARGLGWLQPMEWAILDVGLRWRSPEPMDKHVVIVAINEADLQSVGTYPVPDGVLAQLLQKLQTYQPRGIGLDVIREVPVEPGHDQFVAALKSMDTVIGAESVVPDQSGTVIAPPPALPIEQVGFVD
ncbi:MAG: CHASE2 domain-containing protein, partial [Merismopedia sp. SIO2A8]|nr:CHASE2 domain-containing protein [Merismopedia sp. SIO2A8]